MALTCDPDAPARQDDTPAEVCVLGATGTIGRAVFAELCGRGISAVAVTRQADPALCAQGAVHVSPLSSAEDFAAVFRERRCAVVISCLASRTGVPDDAWAVDYRLNSAALAAAKAAGVRHFVLLSALCVQKPRLAFQQAKLAFEAELAASRLRYSIVRPTAFFKSLSGQIDRVRAGRPYLVFGNGELTACKPLSDRDLAAFIADCLTCEERWNRILPIGGPGAALTPRQQGEALFALLGMTPRFRSVPLQLLDVIGATLRLAGKIIPALAAKAELARIGRYYASESMLVLDPVTGHYDAAATPSTGTETLIDHFQAVLEGRTIVDRGDHAVF